MADGQEVRQVIESGSGNSETTTQCASTSKSVESTSPAPPTLKAYDALRSNLVEAARHSRNLFMTHLAVQSYALIVLAGLDDKRFFERGNDPTLPLINAQVGLGWFLPALSVLSLLVFLYWQFYQRKMWLLAERVKEAARPHVRDSDFVPPDGDYRYPWAGFFSTDSDVVLRMGGVAFAFLQWWLMPLVQYVCWLRTMRLGATFVGWAYGVPWGPAFLVMSVVSVGMSWMLFRVHRYPQSILSKRAMLQSAIQSVTVLPPFIILAIAHTPLQLNWLVAPGRNLAGWNFSRGAELNKANLTGAFLIHANLQEAHLIQARLDAANLGGANLAGSEMRWANLNGANLDWAKLKGANLDAAELKGADLTNARGLMQDQLDKACGDSHTKLPSGLTIKPCLGAE